MSHAVHFVPARFGALYVAENPDDHHGIACLLTLIDNEGTPVTIGLRSEIFRELVAALVEARIPGDRALGRS
ncbi:MAG: hypothetical protein WCF85_16825 [Rhodospirillaceae bacterium]